MSGIGARSISIKSQGWLEKRLKFSEKSADKYYNKGDRTMKKLLEFKEKEISFILYREKKEKYNLELRIDDSWIGTIEGYKTIKKALHGLKEEQDFIAKHGVSSFDKEVEND